MRLAITLNPPSQNFGLDARDPKFWDGGLSVVANLISELEALDAVA